MDNNNNKRFDIKPIVINNMKVTLQKEKREYFRNLVEMKLKELQGSSTLEVPVSEYISLVKEIMEMDGYFDLLPVPMANMEVDRDEWLAIRKHGVHYDNQNHPEWLKYSVGGSTVGAMLGESNFSSPYMVKAKLQGKNILPDKRNNEEILEVGHIAEEFISDYTDELINEATSLDNGTFTKEYLNGFSMRFIKLMEAMQLEENAKKYFKWYFKKFDTLKGKKIVKDEVLYQHPVFKVLNGNVDRFLQTKDGKYEIMEIKSTAVNNFDKQREYKDGAIPLQYLRQIQTYMSIMNMNVATLVAGWGFHSQAISTIHVERDLDEEAKIIGTVLHFIYEIVEKDLEVPETLCNPLVVYEDLERIVPYPVKNKVVETLNYGILEDFKTIQSELDAKKKETKILEKKLDVLKAEILKEAGDANVLTAKDNEDNILTVELSLSSRRIFKSKDARLLLESMGVEITDDMYSVSNTRKYKSY